MKALPALSMMETAGGVLYTFALAETGMMVEMKPSWLNGCEPGLTVMALTTPVVTGLAVAWA